MKTILTVIMTLALSVAFTACKKDKTDSDKQPEPAAKTTDEGAADKSDPAATPTDPAADPAADPAGDEAAGDEAAGDEAAGDEAAGDEAAGDEADEGGTE
jgi:hypothetical protein